MVDIGEVVVSNGKAQRVEETRAKDWVSRDGWTDKYRLFCQVNEFVKHENQETTYTLPTPFHIISSHIPPLATLVGTTHCWISPPTCRMPHILPFSYGFDVEGANGGALKCHVSKVISWY